MAYIPDLQEMARWLLRSAVQWSVYLFIIKKDSWKGQSERVETTPFPATPGSLLNVPSQGTQETTISPGCQTYSQWLYICKHPPVDTTAELWELWRDGKAIRGLLNAKENRHFPQMCRPRGWVPLHVSAPNGHAHCKTGNRRQAAS